MKARGQAIVETALGLLVFVIVLVFCIHFAEVAALSLKLREATASALWDATAQQQHHLPGRFAPQVAAITSAGPGATARYQDFDGRSSRLGGQTVTQVFTGGTALSVTCAPDRAISFAPDAVKTGVLRNVYRDQGGMACSARATLFSWRLPSAFLDQDQRGFFSASLPTAPMVLCGPGRGGRRCGTAGILLDDWGLSGPPESARNPLNDCSQPYCQSVREVFDANGGVIARSAAAMTRFAVGAVPPLPVCWVSYRGEDEPAAFTEQLGGVFPMDPGPSPERRSWPTTPGASSPVVEYGASWAGRSRCFLGEPCR